uniref:Putative ovule protein n=1 Tax=Solanum chacoense TaxID=4108 RepID=A0A0V0GXC0_SOLCH
MRAFEEVELSFGQLSSSLWSLIYFCCTHVVPGCLEEWVSFVENHIFCRFFSFWYPTCLRPIFGL